jgi:hypothetical protein
MNGKVVCRVEQALPMRAVPCVGPCHARLLDWACRLSIACLVARVKTWIFLTRYSRLHTRCLAPAAMNVTDLVMQTPTKRRRIQGSVTQRRPVQVPGAAAQAGYDAKQYRPLRVSVREDTLGAHIEIMRCCWLANTELI